MSILSRQTTSATLDHVPVMSFLPPLARKKQINFSSNPACFPADCRRVKTHHRDACWPRLHTSEERRELERALRSGV